MTALLRIPLLLLRRIAAPLVLDRRMARDRSALRRRGGVSGHGAIAQRLAAALGFVAGMRLGSDRFAYRYSASCSAPTLYASTYACMIRAMLIPAAPPDAESRDWAAFFDAHQDKDGLFQDPVIAHPAFDDSDWWGGRHLALHLVSAYTALGRRPGRPFAFLRRHYDPPAMRRWLESLPWDGPLGMDDDVDNRIMNIGCLLQYQRDAWQDEEAGRAVRTMQEILVRRLDRRTGMWGRYELDDPRQLSRMVQFAYHLLPVLVHDGMRPAPAEATVLQALRTRHRHGGFGVEANSSACEDIDSIEILCALGPDAPRLAPAVHSALAGAWRKTWADQATDGGFVFRRHLPFEYGHQEMRAERGQGALFPTWFRLLALSRIADSAGIRIFRNHRGPGFDAWAGCRPQRPDKVS